MNGISHHQRKRFETQSPDNPIIVSAIFSVTDLRKLVCFGLARNRTFKKVSEDKKKQIYYCKTMTGKVDVLLGLQWGDEGKGKVVDVLTPKYD